MPQLQSCSEAHLAPRLGRRVVSPAGERSRARHQQPQPSRRVDRPAVLVIDDDLGTCETIDRALRPWGVSVAISGNGADGMAIAKSRAFDVILLDQRLPDMAGTDVAHTLRSQHSQAPFVLISGFLTIEIAVDAMKLGAVDVIQKPFDIDDLVDIVLSVLGEAPAKEGDVPAHSRQRAPHSPTEGEAAPLLLARPRPGSVAERWAMCVRVPLMLACPAGLKPDCS